MKVYELVDRFAADLRSAAHYRRQIEEAESRIRESEATLRALIRRAGPIAWAGKVYSLASGGLVRVDDAADVYVDLGDPDGEVAELVAWDEAFPGVPDVASPLDRRLAAPLPVGFPHPDEDDADDPAGSLIEQAMDDACASVHQHAALADQAVS